MKNLEEAMANLTDTKANEIYNELKNKLLDDIALDSDCGFWDLAYDFTRLIGGYTGGSDLYDNDKIAAMTLINYQFSSDDEDSYANDYYLEQDTIEEVKVQYAQNVVSDLQKESIGAIINLDSVKNVHKVALEKEVFQDSIYELANVLKKSTDFSNDLYAFMTQPRG